MTDPYQPNEKKKVWNVQHREMEKVLKWQEKRLGVLAENSRVFGQKEAGYQLNEFHPREEKLKEKHDNGKKK